MSDKVLQKETKADDKRKYFALPDLFLAGIVICAVLLGIFGMFGKSTGEDLVAVVNVGGKVYREIPLTQVQKPYTLSVEGCESEQVELYITSESVEFSHSPCPDKLCVNTGKLTKSGESAVCLPQRVSVKLVEVDGKQSVNQPDAVVG